MRFFFPVFVYIVKSKIAIFSYFSLKIKMVFEYDSQRVFVVWFP